MKHNNKEVNIWKTFLLSSWRYLAVIFLYVNAILYSVSFINQELGIKAICFWWAMSFILINEFSKFMSLMTIYVYKKKGKIKREKLK